MNTKMKKRNFFLIFILVGVIFTNYSFLGATSKPEDLNVLLITIDTIRPDRLSCYSTKYLQTPRIDALAEKGAVFDRAFAHNPLTLPSHVNILLGTTPIYHGVHENSFSIVAEDFLTLAEYLKGKGYATGAFIGAFPLDSRFGLAQGFDVYDESYPSKSSNVFVFPERKAEKVIESAIDWIGKLDSKWFTWIHIWDPHAPYLPPDSFLLKFKDDLYSGEVAYVDSELGKLFDYLEKSNLAGNTLIVLTGDHGEALEEHGESTHGYFAYNSTLWVPLIIAGPGIEQTRVDEYVSHTDIFPTLCDVLGIEKPSFLQGISLLPLLRGKKIKNRAIYFESLLAFYHSGWAPLRGFIEEKVKFIDSPLPEFYNLEDDFDEEENLVQEINLERYQKRMKELIDTYSSLQRPESARKIDREALEKLRSLGYVVSLTPQIKKSYGPEDDLKTLLPIRKKQFKTLTLFWEGKQEECIKLLNEIIQERKNLDRTYVLLSQVYESQGRIEEAIKTLDEGFVNNPEKYEVVSKYGILLVKHGRMDKGIEVLQKALSMVDFDPDVWTHLGIAYWQKGEFQRALKHYEKALSLDVNNAIIFNNLGMLYFSIFMQTKNREDHTQSAEYFKKAIGFDPNLASAYNGLGSTYRVIGRIDEAISLWERSLELDPNFDFPVYNLGLAYFGKGNKNQALKYFEKYLSLKKDTLSTEELRKIEGFIKRCK